MSGSAPTDRPALTESPDDETAVNVSVRDMQAATGQDLSAGRMHLVVVGDDAIAAHQLPERGIATIGRGTGVTIRIEAQTISRIHAQIHLGPQITIEDLESANGTFVRGQRLEPKVPTPIGAGDSIQLGSCLMVIQRQSAPLRARRFWTHDAFEARLEEECARASRTGGRFGLLRLQVTSGDVTSVQEVLAELVRSSDVIGIYGPREYEVLLLDAPPREAEQALARIRARLDAKKIEARLGVSTFPRDEQSPQALLASVRRASAPPAAEGRPGAIIADPAMKSLYELAARVAPSGLNVLILGETGAGKELLAEAVHRNSPRAAKRFLKLNCAAFPESLLESELFGHEKGAFTNAVAAKQGLLRVADGGTVFLDEIGDMPLALQAKLLRVIEDRQILPIGGIEPIEIDVRFIAATHRDLESAAEAGHFRRDLFYRLNGVALMIPPLRERTAEIEPLARQFAGEAARESGYPPPDFTPEALELLRNYGWPGNVRELRNVIERAVLLAGNEAIGPEHLPRDKIGSTFARPTQSFGVPSSGPPDWLPPRPRGRGDAERQWILDALDRCGGSQTRAAQMLGISRRTLINRLDEYGLARPRKRAKGEDSTDTSDTTDASDTSDADEDVD